VISDPVMAMIAMFALIGTPAHDRSIRHDFYDYVSPQEVEGFNFLSTIGYRTIAVASASAQPMMGMRLARQRRPLLPGRRRAD